MLAEATPNQSDGASWRRELAPEPEVEGTWPEPRTPGEEGDPGSPWKVSCRCWETSGLIVHPHLSHLSDTEHALYHK